MKVLHVIAGLSRDSGGPSRSSQGLVAAECACGVDAWLHSLDGACPWMSGVRNLEGDFSSQLNSFDLIHLHGIWSWGLHRICVACRKMRVPYVISPRGMLESWSLKQKYFKKRLARFFYQDYDLRCAAALHATADSEANQFRKLGFINRIIISSNGVNVPEKLPQRKLVKKNMHRAVFLSRIHPKKGLLELVDAWASVRPSGWKMEIVGTDADNYERTVRARVEKLGVADSFIFTGPLMDEAKWDAYHRADLFIFPSYCENFGIVIAEALYAGVPVITTKGTPWAELVDRCGWWIDLPPRESLEQALRVATSLSDEERFRMGEAGHDLISGKYLWSTAAKIMISGYREVVYG